MRLPRCSGVLLHPTSLPGPHGSGDLGAQAYRFVDWLVSAGQALWQMPATFDTIFLMGINYHDPEPLEMFHACRHALREGGTLICESVVVETEDDLEIFPEGRYAGIGGVYAIPSPRALRRQLQFVGFQNVTLLYSAALLPAETRGGVLYHCGPVVLKENGKYKITAAGPTTSIREEPYQADVIGKLGFRAVIGKGHAHHRQPTIGLADWQEQPAAGRQRPRAATGLLAPAPGVVGGRGVPQVQRLARAEGVGVDLG